jgi:tetratricopeptide (TPR) repeat protein
VLGLPTVGHDLVAAVLGIDPDGAVAALDRLVDARMIDSRGERYGMHDLIRLFAADLAHRTEPAAVRSYTLRTAISWYALTARRASELLRPQMRFAAPLVGVTPVRTGLADAADAMAWLDAEHSNCVQLVRRAVGPDTGLAALGAQVVLALYPSLVMRSYSHDWDVLCQLVLDAEDRVGEPMVTARVLTYRAFSLRGQLRLDEAVRYLDRALSIQRTVGDTVGESTTQDVLGMVLVSRGEFERSLRHFDRALDLRRQNGPALAEAVTLSNAAEPLARLGRFTEALSYLERSLEIRREHDDRGGEAVTLSNLAEVHLLRGDLDRTLNYADLALTASRDGGDRELERRALVLGARTLLRMNRGADMHHRIDQALDVAAASGGLFDGSDLRELAAELRAAGHRASAERIGVQLEALRVRT